ncbi:MAG: CDP-diacylglycerol--glycerol-3-phosphate 3-phosphatidyltransferase [Actinomycetota bacterium]|nr:CDP-diacylglycerol--glycerol-3-phosphate 3-phosphatidyltransferase [Actinomycetota bacterium]
MPTAVARRRGVSAWNAANALTLLRLLLVPVFVALLFADSGGGTGWRIAAASVFVLAGVTDLVDGEVARRRGVVTDVGKIADPIADKALNGAALVGLSVLQELPWWVTGVILSREIAVTLLRLAVLRHGVIAASRGGKVKTVAQGVAIALFVLPLGAGWQLFAGLVMAFALAVTLLTGADYAVRALRLHRRGAAAGGGSP